MKCRWVVADTIACANGMTGKIAVESLRAMYVAYCRVVRVRAMLWYKEARDSGGGARDCRAWRVEGRRTPRLLSAVSSQCRYVAECCE
ncbi:hypothetical protein HBI56_055950 [Parastagonospora nodorum]|uniref:Uncharacterized protein n=1 Tax=Phaeosphaeria nodorum (strain SN15 / ATCC MYA-4574 / FGSC 10173) TaxID=321614 RepID=A0A7U2IC99_PHANO|nr:hypothetical protein HBH56_096160 [Parastagonospora nodorum]QRD07219.1 hypothetical protein JI435_424080 [Parastagonospora nodorum SN15]KAH3930151.1 hypothetical protein HBH54_110480 [Parastagonospora nodorum]KAH3944965.1 hypothetical protein HBH53_148960 [Parastagonospora nodorum]KAH3966943.1 hypothetical protein HBH51_140350 [Parastagonospora nodorum]